MTTTTTEAVERGASCEELEVWGVFRSLREAALHARDTTRDPLGYFTFWRANIHNDEYTDAPRRIDERELVALGVAERDWSTPPSPARYAWARWRTYP